ncbi:alpha/beta fold hydrolase [Mitsuaria sp. WAJ17]|uniref:alpha/beta hydrolase n=1 Tax=Mitsuaria sp. WAJ17 TaxID=2761452 RepID=UPI0016038360|nr:alpha/beta fold hydrolase [Mitsuaria sp. WAJ17]MBB2487489.1 alpha/beta fold hydrolase [Mitsuaria sp. WAJ17]
MPIIEKDWNVQRSSIVIKGSLCLPAEGRFPIALILQGSGQVDRNGNVRGRGPAIYAKLARALAEFGVASYRYDKRGAGASGGNFLETGYHDLVGDAQACWESLVTAPFCDPERMYMVGHSEGTAMAAQLAARVVHRPRALVQLCPFVDGAEAMLIHQADQIERELPDVPGLLGLILRVMNRLTGPYGQSLRKLLERVRTLEGGTVRLGSARVSARWLRELIELDMHRIYRDVPCPMLLLSGEKDLQCTPDSAGKLAELVDVPTEHHVVPDMIHHLSACEGPPALFDLRDIDPLPLSPALLECLQQWFARESIDKRVPDEEAPALGPSGA